MMNVEEIKKELIRTGKNPEDFNISLFNNGYSVTPKWFYETKQVAKQEVKPIIDDVNITAETIVYTAQDVMMLADTVTQLLNRVIELEGKING